MSDQAETLEGALRGLERGQVGGLGDRDEP